MNTKQIQTMLASPQREAMLRELANHLAERMIDEGWLRSCLNCDHFDKVKELCMFANYGQRPPAKIIVSGCENHSDLIPF